MVALPEGEKTAAEVGVPEGGLTDPGEGRWCAGRRRAGTVERGVGSRTSPPYWLESTTPHETLLELLVRGEGAALAQQLYHESGTDLVELLVGPCRSVVVEMGLGDGELTSPRSLVAVLR